MGQWGTPELGKTHYILQTYKPRTVLIFKGKSQPHSVQKHTVWIIQTPSTITTGWYHPYKIHNPGLKYKRVFMDIQCRYLLDILISYMSIEMQMKSSNVAIVTCYDLSQFSSPYQPLF